MVNAKDLRDMFEEIRSEAGKRASDFVSDAKKSDIKLSDLKMPDSFATITRRASCGWASASYSAQSSEWRSR